MAKICPNCGISLSFEARFCSACGAPQVAAISTKSTQPIRWSEPLPPQLHQQFTDRLRQRVKTEQDDQRTSDYQEQVYSSGFRETLQRRFEQWSTQLTTPQTIEEEDIALAVARQLIDDLLDFFFIVHCQALNTVVLPQAILGYQGEQVEPEYWAQMGLEFLDFINESERVHTDYLQLSAKQIQNATKAFLAPSKEEQIWFICDQSLMGNLKRGFAMTDQALYWKSGLQASQCVYYHNLRSIEKEKEWLLINELYFNATPSLNTKLIWLLRKLARLVNANL